MAILKAYDTERLTAVLKKAAAVNMAFEINPRHADRALEWFRELIQEARGHGTKFTLGTDAHAIKSLGYPDNDSGRTCGDVIADLGITDDDLKWAPIAYRGA
jgi:histidinol phosphatase-like PHP family hydrolase